jgi:hypothetical protein
MNNKEITYARGRVVDNFVSIELAINAIISQNFLGKIDINFVINVLNNEQSSFAFKRNILVQLIDSDKYKKKIEELHRLNNLRNIFGHASLRLRSGQSREDENAVFDFNDPRKKDNILDAQKLLDEFTVLYPIVLEWLITLGKERGITHTILG